MNGTSPLAIIRADASLQIGGGHVMRCLTLADQLNTKGWNIALCGMPETSLVVPALAQSNYAFYPLHTQGNAAELMGYFTHGCELLIIDHYGLDYSFEHTCRSWANRIMVIDDLANRKHDCDFLLDQTLGRAEQDYDEYVPTQCRLLLGTNYALLRPQFAAARETSLQRRQHHASTKRILISYGTADPDNLTARTIEALILLTYKGQVDIVLSARSEHFEVIKIMAKNAPFSINIHSDVKDMAELMSRADIAIGAGGTTSWERCCLGLPSLIIVIADNQKLIADKLQNAGAIEVLGWHEDVDAELIAAAVERLLSNPLSLNHMSIKAAQVCDGAGAHRVVEEIAA